MCFSESGLSLRFILRPREDGTKLPTDRLDITGLLATARFYFIFLNSLANVFIRAARLGQIVSFIVRINQ